MRPKFGPAGNSDSFSSKEYKSSIYAPKYCHEFGLDAYEFQCGRGVRLSTDMGEKLKNEAVSYGVQMSVHASYYISLSSVDPEKRYGSSRYFLESADAVRRLGGTRFVVHSGSCGKLSRKEALLLAKETLKYCLDEMDSAGFSDITVCPETMGKIGQLGSLEEVMELCSIDERVLPCIDFGHLNARTQGGIKSDEDYAYILDTMEKTLGKERSSSFHSHFSKIEYSTGGEKRHLTFEDSIYGPDPRILMRLVAKRKLSPTIICESAGTQAEDALIMKTMYEEELKYYE
ncbi:MAG: TIM barrel protein [Oscillospiraceae bacterium]|nr:TIM barrel protein [Oscillospiraceae bacterium]